MIDAPKGYIVRNQDDDAVDILGENSDRSVLSDAQQRFWSEFLENLRLDDPEQQIPRPARQGYLGFMMPAPSGSSWLTIYRDVNRREVGLFLSSHRNTAGSYAMQAIAEQWNEIQMQLGGTAKLTTTRDGRDTVTDTLGTGPLEQAQARKEAFIWLAERVNTFVNVIRPRVRSAAADYKSHEN